MALTGMVEGSGRILPQHATARPLLVDREPLPHVPGEDSAPLFGRAAIPHAPALGQPDLSASSHRITHGRGRRGVSTVVTSSPVPRSIIVPRPNVRANDD